MKQSKFDRVSVGLRRLGIDSSLFESIDSVMKFIMEGDEQDGSPNESEEGDSTAHVDPAEPDRPVETNRFPEYRETGDNIDRMYRYVEIGDKKLLKKYIEKRSKGKSQEEYIDDCAKKDIEYKTEPYFNEFANKFHLSREDFRRCLLAYGFGKRDVYTMGFGDPNTNFEMYITDENSKETYVDTKGLKDVGELCHYIADLDAKIVSPVKLRAEKIKDIDGSNKALEEIETMFGQYKESKAKKDASSEDDTHSNDDGIVANVSFEDQVNLALKKIEAKILELKELSARDIYNKMKIEENKTNTKISIDEYLDSMCESDVDKLKSIVNDKSLSVEHEIKKTDKYGNVTKTSKNYVFGQEEAIAVVKKMYDAIKSNVKEYIDEEKREDGKKIEALNKLSASVLSKIANLRNMSVYEYILKSLKSDEKAVQKPIIELRDMLKDVMSTVGKVDGTGALYENKIKSFIVYPIASMKYVSDKKEIESDDIKDDGKNIERMLKLSKDEIFGIARKARIPVYKYVWESLLADMEQIKKEIDAQMEKIGETLYDLVEKIYLNVSTLISTDADRKIYDTIMSYVPRKNKQDTTNTEQHAPTKPVEQQVPLNLRQRINGMSPEDRKKLRERIAGMYNTPQEEPDDSQQKQKKTE